MESSEDISHLHQYLPANLARNLFRALLRQPQPFRQIADKGGRMREAKEHESRLTCERGHLVYMQEILLRNILNRVCGIHGCNCLSEPLRQVLKCGAKRIFRIGCAGRNARQGADILLFQWRGGLQCSLSQSMPRAEHARVRGESAFGVGTYRSYRANRADWAWPNRAWHRRIGRKKPQTRRLSSPSPRLPLNAYCVLRTAWLRHPPLFERQPRLLEDGKHHIKDFRLNLVGNLRNLFSVVLLNVLVLLDKGNEVCRRVLSGKDALHPFADIADLTQCQSVPIR